MTPAQEQAARLLARGMTLTAIAAKMAISLREIEAWFEEPEFVALCARRKEFEERLVKYRLPALALRIIEQLCRQLASPNPKSVQAALTAGVRLWRRLDRVRLVGRGSSIASRRGYPRDR